MADIPISSHFFTNRDAKYLFEEIEESLTFLLLLLLLLLDNTLRLWRLYSYLYPNGVCIGGDYE